MHHHLCPPPPPKYVKAVRDERGFLCLPTTPDGTAPIFRLALKRLFQVESGDDTRLVTRELGTFGVPTPHGNESLTLNYEGVRLGQWDLDVLLALQLLAAPAGLGQMVEASGRQVLEACGLSDCSANYVKLRSSLGRLWRARFTVVSATSKSGLPWLLLATYTHRQESRNGAGAVGITHRISYVIGEEWGGLFHENTWVKLDTNMRRRLKGRGEKLARWLHTLLSTQKLKYTTNIAELYEQSGAECAPDAFLRQFRDACAVLTACGAVSHIDYGHTGRLRIKDKPMPSLRRREVTFVRPSPGVRSRFGDTLKHHPTAPASGATSAPLADVEEFAY